MPINLEDIIERAFESAFSKALDQTLQAKAEALFKRAFENGSPLAKKLEEKIDQGFQKFVEEGVRWEKRKPGFKNAAIRGESASPGAKHRSECR